MENIEIKLRNKLITAVQEALTIGWFFLKNPDKDFTRNRKFTLEEVIKFTLVMNGLDLSKELLEYFNFDVETPTSSAFIQQYDKVLPEFYEFLFYHFTDTVKKKKSKCHGYTLLACDGSSINIRTDSTDKETYINATEHRIGCNKIHLNTLYDLTNKIYTNVLLKNGACSEVKALIEMLKTGNFDEKTIIICDRGYEGYPTFSYIERLGLKYLVRIKDVDSTGILQNRNLPDDEEFDIYINPILTKKQTKFVKNSKEDYVKISKDSLIDFLDLYENKYYPMHIRIVHFEISRGKYECIATNLPKSKFSMKDIKKLYSKRWGIETSYRHLKYDIGLTNLHFKKLDSIHKEIYAKLTMFNYYGSFEF